MRHDVELTAEQREVLDRVRERLLAEGFRVSDERLVMALLRGAAQLPEGDLMRLLKEGLGTAQPEGNPHPKGKQS